MTSDEWDSRPAPPPHDPWESGDEKWIDLTPAERRSARAVITTTLVVVVALVAISIVIALTRTSALSADSDLVGAGTVPTPTASATARPVPAPALVLQPTPSTTPVAVTPVPSIPPAVDVEPSGVAAVVTDVVDGDTIRVDLPNGIETVRIIGIDTPEVVHPTEPEACFGAEASAFARETLDGQAVTLELDPTQDERDRYDRLLAHVHVGDTCTRPRPSLAATASTTSTSEPSIHAAELDAAADTAREAGLGIWASCEGRVDLPLVPVVEPAPVDEPDPEPPANADCHPSYDPCVPNAGHDLDCGDIGFSVTVIGPDEYRLDAGSRRRRLRELLMKRRYTHCDCRIPSTC